MKLVNASFSFKNKKGTYRVDFYPTDLKTRHRAILAVNGMTHKEVITEGRQVVSVFHAKKLIKEFTKFTDES
jgi:hypothetical protein